MARSKEEVVQMVVEHLLDINHGTFKLTEEDIALEEDAAMQEVFAGLLCLNEDLTFRQQRRQEAEQHLQQTHEELLDASRRAGMAEMATNILHDVGNALNSARVSLTLIDKRLRSTRFESLKKASDLLQNNKSNLRHFLDQTPQGKVFPSFLDTISEHLLNEQKRLLEELQTLDKSLDHIKHIIRTQQSYARSSSEVETVELSEILDMALYLSSASFERYNIEIVRNYEPLPRVKLDRHRVLQILTNLLSNARHALRDSEQTNKAIIIALYQNEETLVVSVTDNGIGMTPDTLKRIFNHGFTTKSDGNGFGLHSSANAAALMGGALSCHSQGPNHGATFTLTLPVSTTPPAAN